MELLNTIGKATPNRPLKAETLFADLWFEPKAQSQEERVHLGLLGRLLPRNALIEVFRNPATVFEIRSCKHKLFADEADRVRKATKQKKTAASIAQNQRYPMAEVTRSLRRTTTGDRRVHSIAN
jgi:hypothetical protein